MATTPVFPPSDIPTVAGAHAEWLASSGASGTQADFSGLDLSGYDLRNQNWTRAKFAGAVLATAKLDPCTLTGADLSGVTVNWSSHYLWQEMFRQLHAGDPTMEPYIAQVTDLKFHCWDWFMSQWPIEVAQSAYDMAVAAAITDYDRDQVALIGRVLAARGGR
jgi:hypothetical protein